MSVIMKRLPKGADLLEAITQVCKDNAITRGSVQVIGALDRAVVGFYLFEEKRYITHPIDENVEILSGLGNVSFKDGVPFIHMHLTLGREDGGCLGGHAMAGCPIFAAEVCIHVSEGIPLEREMDDATGLFLWKQS